MNLEDKTREFIKAKRHWQESPMIPFRKMLKRAYQKLEAELYDELPNVYEIDGLIINKGHTTAMSKTGKRTYNFLAIFSKESWDRKQAYYKKSAAHVRRN